MSKERKSFKEFNQRYDAFLLRTPHAANTLGDFAEIEKRFWLDIHNESIIEELSFPAEMRKKYRNYLENVPLISAEIPDVSIEKELLIDIGITIPTMKVNPNLKVNREKIVHYQFEDIRVKVLKNSNELEIRRILDKAIDELNKKDKRDLKSEIGRLNKTYIVEELYYAKDVSLKIQNGYGLDVKAELELKEITGMEVKTSIDSANNHDYHFSGDYSVPFAAKVIAITNL